MPLDAGRRHRPPVHLMARRERLGRLLRSGGDRLRRKLQGDRDVPDRATVRFGDVSGEVPGGISLLAAASKLDVDLDHFCGGQASCGTCRVEVVAGAEHLGDRRGPETMTLGQRADDGDRLACQARVLGDVHVRIPDFFLSGTPQ